MRWWGWRSGDAWVPEFWVVVRGWVGSSASHVVRTVRPNTSHIIGRLNVNVFFFVIACMIVSREYRTG